MDSITIHDPPAYLSQETNDFETHLIHNIMISLLTLRDSR